MMEELSELSRAVLAELKEQLRVVKERREELPPGGFDRDVTDAAAKLSRAVSTMENEQRQKQRAEARDMKLWGVQQVLNRCKEFTEAEREHIMRELERMNAGGRIF